MGYYSKTPTIQQTAFIRPKAKIKDRINTDKVCILQYCFHKSHDENKACRYLTLLKCSRQQHSILLLIFI